MSTVPLRRELHSGPLGVIWGVELGDGSCPAEAFLMGLELRARAQFKARFERVGEVGNLRAPEMGHYLDAPGKPPIYQIKAECGPGYRLYVVRKGMDWYATHGCKKPKDRKVAAQAVKARGIYATGGGSE